MVEDSEEEELSNDSSNNHLDEDLIEASEKHANDQDIDESDTTEPIHLTRVSPVEDENLDAPDTIGNTFDNEVRRRFGNTADEPETAAEEPLRPAALGDDETALLDEHSSSGEESDTGQSGGATSGKAPSVCKRGRGA